MKQEMVNKTNDDEFKEVLAPPDWLNAAFVLKALHSGGQKKIAIKQLTIKPAVAPGNNYASVIYRATATLQNEEKRSVVIKTLPPGEVGRMIQEIGIFKSESIMFQEVVPEIEALLESAAPGRFPPLTARSLLYGREPSDHLVLEDLAPQGFQLADRHRGLGLRHSLLALRALARYHAASVGLLQKDPSVEGKLPNVFTSDDKTFDIFIMSMLESAIEGIRKWSGFEEYARLLEAFKPHILSKYAELSVPKPEKLKVISHGDFWVSNMLFRYEDGVPQEVRLVDLQISYVTSPALDLLYFLGSSLTEDVSINHRDLLLREYHKALSETMQLLELKPPSLEELLEDIDEHGCIALFGTLGTLPVMKATKKVEMDGMLNGDNSETIALYQDPAVKRWLQRLLPEYKRRGWLPS